MPLALSSSHHTTAPTVNADSTISAVVLGSTPQGRALRLLRVWLPPSAWEPPFGGRFWMARCVEDQPAVRSQEWSIYLRRPLLVAGLPIPAPHAHTGDHVDLLLGPSQDAGAAWLAARPPGSRINLLGPFGRPHTPPVHCRALLILTLPDYVPIWLPAIHDLLDRGGRVTVVTPPPAEVDRLRPLLPLPVELRAAADEQAWDQHLDETLRWADHLCASLPPSAYQPLADRLRQARFRVEPGFAHALVPADLACGFGACLACAVALPDGGMTRACLHGPVFPLERITV